MKIAFLEVSCANNLADDLPVFFHITIDDALSQRIKLLSEKVKELGCFSIHEFNNCGGWYDDDIDNSLIDGDIDQVDIEQFLTSNKESDANVTCEYLQITQDDFCWSGYPKHGSDDLKLSTGRIPIEFLDGEHNVWALNKSV